MNSTKYSLKSIWHSNKCGANIYTMSNVILTWFSLPNVIKCLHKYIFKTLFSYDVIYILQVFTSLLVGCSTVLALFLICTMYVGRNALPVKLVANKNSWRRKNQATCLGTGQGELKKITNLFHWKPLKSNKLHFSSHSLESSTASLSLLGPGGVSVDRYFHLFFRLASVSRTYPCNI